jgi:hypothetical protein
VRPLRAAVLLALCLLHPTPLAAQRAGAVPPPDSATVHVPVSPGDRPGMIVHYRIELAAGVALAARPAASLQGFASGGALLRLPLQVTLPAAGSPGPVAVATLYRLWSDGTADTVAVPTLYRLRSDVTADTELQGAPAWRRSGASSEPVRAAPVAVRRGALPPSFPLATEAVPAGGAYTPPRGSAAPGRPEGQEWASAPVGGLAREVEVELYGTTRTASPGGLVVVRWSLNSYEDEDQRVGLRLLLPPGWELLDDDATGREWLLEGWESLEGEIRVSVPAGARPGERYAIRMRGEVAGEPGYAAVYSWVLVTRRGGLRAGQAGLTGTTSLHASNLESDRLEGARYGGVVDLSGRLSRENTLTVNYRQGPRESALTNFRIAQEDTRWSGTLRRPSWNLQLGNQVMSGGSVLTGPFVRGQGGQLRRTQGLLVGELAVVQPTSFISDPAGHLVRGNVGLSGARGRLGVAFSDFGRPGGGYSTLPRYPEDIDPEVLERLERERQALARAARNRVQGAGLDAELQLAGVHRFTARGGLLRLSNARGDTVQEPALEALYALQHRRATLNLRWRQMPVSLAGIQLPGNEQAVDGSLRVIGEWRLAARAHRTRALTLGNEFRSEGEGASAGVRWFRGGWRLDLSGNVREWSWGDSPTEARTVNASLGAPLGPLSLNAFASVGEQRRDTVRAPSASYSGSLRWNGRSGSLTWSGSYFETLSAPPRLRTDLLASLRVEGWELAGGAWATRGLLRGGEPGVWGQVGVPLSPELMLNLGLEHAPAGWGEAPRWMGTLGVRQKVTLPIPFLRDGSPAR